MRSATVLVLVLVVVGCSAGKKGPSVEERIWVLQEEVGRQQQTSAEAVHLYTPTVQGQIDDLNTPIADVLRQLPGVADVELLAVPNPTHRIIHLRDWHYVPADLFALDVGLTPPEDGRVQADPARVEARHDGQVKAALKSGNAPLLILGGSHDLSGSVRRSGGKVEYVRVTTRRYKEFSGE